jgi:hypothetical protein
MRKILTTKEHIEPSNHRTEGSRFAVRGEDKQILLAVHHILIPVACGREFEIIMSLDKE